MSKIEWDKVGERFIENGVDHVVLYPQDEEGKYTKGVAWNGVTGVEENPDGAEPNDFYADNIKYASLRSAETFGATIKAYTYPDEFAECDGTASPADGVYLGQQKRKPFGLCYRTQVSNDTATDGDDGYKLHIIYNATCSPSDRDYATIDDNPDAIEFSWEVDTTPVNVTGYKPVSSVVIDSLKADATKLAALEEKLYGTATAEPALPTPDELITMMKTTSGD